MLQRVAALGFGKTPGYLQTILMNSKPSLVLIVHKMGGCTSLHTQFGVVEVLRCGGVLWCLPGLGCVLEHEVSS